jgi:protein subunit release factor B
MDMDGQDGRPPFATDRETLEREALVEFVRASGPGGQHRNKRETGVRLVHPPSGLTIMATERRSQAQNREVAFERLAERLAELDVEPRERVATAPPKAERRRRREQKERRAETKQLRRPPQDE